MNLLESEKRTSRKRTPGKLKGEGGKNSRPDPVKLYQFYRDRTMIRWNKFINVMVKWFRIQQKHPPKRKRKPMERPTFSNTWENSHIFCLKKKVHYVFQLGSNVWYTSTNGGCSADFPIAMWDCRTIPSVELSRFFPTTCMIMMMMMIPLIVEWSKDVTGLGESSFHPMAHDGCNIHH